MDITDSQIGQIFPFFFQMDDQGQIILTGPSLQRYISTNQRPISLFDQFVFQTPRITSLDQIENSIGEILLLSVAAEQKLVLRGQFLRLEAHQGILFIGIPWITDINAVNELGLTIGDYSLYEPTTYFLMLSTAQKNTLENSECIAQQLKELNDSLASRVERRTERLSQINQELIASETKLRDEMQQREEIEIELRLAQKMEALGQLSAGIAHEINTPIQFIGDSLRFIQEATEDLQQATTKITELIDIQNPETRQQLLSIGDRFDLDYLHKRVPESIDRAILGVDRVSTIVKSMKAFSHHDESAKNFANVNEAIENTLVVTRNEYKLVASVETHLAEIPELYCNIGGLNQVFLNLIINSAHAISERFDNKSSPELGKIVITTSKLEDGILIVFKDNGCGIPASIIEKIYDPFFTTKAIGKGSGQGLSFCHRIIINQHDGTIKVDSQPGEFTEFRIHLPITTPEDHNGEATS